MNALHLRRLRTSILVENKLRNGDEYGPANLGSKDGLASMVCLVSSPNC